MGLPLSLAPVTRGCGPTGTWFPSVAKVDRFRRAGTASGRWKQDLYRPNLLSSLAAVQALAAAVGRHNVELKAVGRSPQAVPSAVAMWSALVVQRCVVDPIGAVAGEALRLPPLRFGRGIQVG